MRGFLIALGVFVVLSAIGLIYYFSQQRNKTSDSFDTEKPIIADVVKKSVATGSIKPRLEIMIKPQVSGVVQELYVEEGEAVIQGQKLAKIKLVPNEVNINTAQSNLELAKLRLTEAKRELQRQKEVFSKNLDVESAQATYDNALEQEQRQRQLLDEGVIAQQAYDQFKLDLNIATAALDNAKIIANNSLKQFETQVDIRKQELDAAVNNLQLLREGASSNSRQVNNVIVSTVQGMVLDIPVETGSSVIERNNFNEGTTIATVADMSNLIFEGKVDESEVGKLREGMPLTLTVGAIEGHTFDAILEFISPKGVDEEGTVKFEVRAAVKPSEEVFLRAGYSANGDIIMDRRDQVIAIKERDVLFENDTNYVQVLVGDREFEKRPIQLGLSDGIQVEVLNGLDTTTQIKVLKGDGEG